MFYCVCIRFFLYITDQRKNYLPPQYVQAISLDVFYFYSWDIKINLVTNLFIFLFVKPDFCFFSRSYCRKCHLGWIFERSDSERHRLQDEDHSGNYPHLFPGSLHLNSGMSSERIQSEPGLVGSEELHAAWTGRPKCDSLSYWTH